MIHFKRWRNKIYLISMIHGPIWAVDTCKSQTVDSTTDKRITAKIITWNSKSTENEQICSLFIICRSTNEEMKKWIPVVDLEAKPISCIDHASMKTQHTAHSRFFSSWIKLNILSISLFIYDTLTNITHTTQHINSWIIQTIRLALWFASQSDAPLKQDAEREKKNLYQ